ncbi:DNA/RNA non-specific endonuclease [Nibrella viscosa]|uniref:DNA/RNA non-specific endonuclease n=1 Tax=Nibrella viscosa TaxID=1084524 RepID=A0ABP8L2B6_9BACT
MKSIEERIRLAVRKVETSDKQLAKEFEKIRRTESAKEEARSMSALLESAVMGPVPLKPGIGLETIVLRLGRPVLSVLMDRAVLQFGDVESEVWRERLEKADELLTSAIRSVGRIELTNHTFFDWVGTGWLVADDVVVTNRHVAELFGRHENSKFVFRQGRGGRTISATIDFLEEFSRTDDLTFSVESILHIEPENGPDIAFLRVKVEAGRQLAEPIMLETDRITGTPDVAVIGYPARDSRIPDQQLMVDIFGDVFDKKRLAPGQITGLTTEALLHDCSTLGGNSGSVVLDMQTGRALGLHFAGRFLDSNFAVSAELISDRLKKFTKQPVPSPSGNKDQGSFNGIHPSTHMINIPAGAGQPGQHTIQFTIPVQISVTIGNPVQSPVAPSGGSSSAGRQTGVAEEEDFIEEEARPADYVNRPGYVPDFLGANAEVPLPEPGDQLREDVLTFTGLGGQTEYILKYQHFSVVMSRSRRMCLFSAVNIDGKTSAKRKRVGWRLDPRIPTNAQIRNECYGDPPKFSRGHMTRREDPVWGSADAASTGNADSMHVTNAVPQMQPFNAGIWLGLEDYALDHAREDDMRISVFTGPVFREDDPVRFGVRIPRTFWKIIAFIHDHTQQLSATGYTMSQEAFLREEEFVFGQHRTAQVPIAGIEALTDLSFGRLTEADPLNRQQEAPQPDLTSLSQIRFISRNS